MDAATLSFLIATCAANINAHTMSEVVRIESNGNPLAINVNGLRRQPPPAQTLEQAIQTAKTYL